MLIWTSFKISKFLNIIIFLFSFFSLFFFCIFLLPRQCIPPEQHILSKPAPVFLMKRSFDEALVFDNTNANNEATPLLGTAIAPNAKAAISSHTTDSRTYASNEPAYAQLLTTAPYTPPKCRSKPQNNHRSVEEESRLPKLSTQKEK